MYATTKVFQVLFEDREEEEAGPDAGDGEAGGS